MFIKKSSLSTVIVSYTGEIPTEIVEGGYVIIGVAVYLLIIILTILYIRSKTLNSAIQKYKLLMEGIEVNNQVRNNDKGAFDESIKFFQECGVIFHIKAPSNKADLILLQEVITAIREKYADPEFDVNNIIAQVGMSRSVFYKKIKFLSNQSLSNLLRNYRLTKAAELLAKGQHSVSQAAYECGFSDPAYFSKVFKERFNLSPKNYFFVGDSHPNHHSHNIENSQSL